MSNGELKRDSLFLTHTMWEYYKLQYDTYSFFKQFKIPKEYIEINVDSIFYSPDNLKLVSFIVCSYPLHISISDSRYYSDEGKKYLSKEFNFSAEAFVGIRESKNQPWEIYRIQEVAFAGCLDYQCARKSIREFFQNGYKNIEVMVPNEIPDTLYRTQLEMSRNTTFRLESMKYNLGEDGFWSEDCTLWKKGLRAKDKYLFQTDTHQPISDQIVILPEIEYPDSLLKMFTK
jgi:hypothetical protein